MHCCIADFGDWVECCLGAVIEQARLPMKDEEGDDPWRWIRLRLGKMFYRTRVIDRIGCNLAFTLYDVVGVARG